MASSSSRSDGLRRTTSAGYRLPNRTPTTSKLDSTSYASFSSPSRGREALPQSPFKGARAPPPPPPKDEAARREDQVRRDHTWREFVEAERRAGRRWHESWGFLKDYDSMGNEKEHEELPEYVSVFSDKYPNTTNQTVGSRTNTEIGQLLINMDYFLATGNQKKKLGSELLPC